MLHLPIGKRRVVVAGLALWFGLASALLADTLPPPFNTPGHVHLALVRFFSSGDFFHSYLAGVEAQSSALGATLHVFDSQQDPDRQAQMVDQAIALGVHGIIIQHGLPQTLRLAARRAVAAGVKVVAFDVDLDLEAVPQVDDCDGAPHRVPHGSEGTAAWPRGAATASGMLLIYTLS